MCVGAPKPPGPSKAQMQAELAAKQAEAAENQRSIRMREQENARRRAGASGGQQSLLSGGRSGFRSSLG